MACQHGLSIAVWKTLDGADMPWHVPTQAEAFPIMQHPPTICSLAMTDNFPYQMKNPDVATFGGV